MRCAFRFMIYEVLRAMGNMNLVKHGYLPPLCILQLPSPSELATLVEDKLPKYCSVTSGLDFR
jgi:hypothetical protein